MTQTRGERSMQFAQGIFGGLKEAKARVDSPWLKEGHYYLRIDLVKIDQNRHRETAVFIEQTVVCVLDDGGVDPESGRPVGHKVGEAVTHSIWNKHDSFLGNVKQFLAAATGMQPAGIGEQDVFAVIGDDQPLGGTVVEAKNRMILIDDKARPGQQKPFTLINYQREIPAAELLEALSAETQEMFFPNGVLTQMAAFDAQQAGVPVQPAAPAASALFGVVRPAAPAASLGVPGDTILGIPEADLPY